MNDDIVAAFPLPPYYYQEEHKLQKPALPVEEYEMFGTVYKEGELSSQGDLSENGIEQLFENLNSSNASDILKSLNWSLVQTYSELIDAVVESPTEAGVKTDDIRILLLNMHFIINFMRKSQGEYILKKLVEREVLIRDETVQSANAILSDTVKKLENLL